MEVIRSVKPTAKIMRVSLCAILATAAFSVPARANLAFAETGETVPSKIEGQVQWDDEENAQGKRPGEVTVRLVQDGKEIATAQASSENEWNYAFDVEVPADGKANYQVTADETEGYVEDESRHVDPELDFTYPQSGDWNKYAPNNRLTISEDLLSGGIVAGKTTAHHPMVVWTSEELTPLQQKLVFESLKGIPGSGNPSSAVFVTGDASTEYGMSVLASEGVVKFERPSDWALLYAGMYQKGSCDFTRALIVKKLIEQTDPDPDNPGTDPDPDNPGTDPDPDNPGVDPNPGKPGGGSSTNGSSSNSKPDVHKNNLSAGSDNLSNQVGYAYQDAHQSGSGMPQTGDNALPLGLGALAVAALLASLVLVRRIV